MKDLLTPYKIPFPKIRVGDQGDGGYILFDTGLKDIDATYSYGIGDNYSFDREIAERTGKPVYMYDPTIEDPTKGEAGLSFTKGGCSNVVMHTIHNNEWKAGAPRLILKMDVEGAEWRVLHRLLLTQEGDIFEQMAIEFHNLHDLEDMPQMATVSDAFRVNTFKMLNNLFYLGHIHGNNCGDIKDGLPNTIECTYIRKDLLTEVPEIETEPYPTALDYPNEPTKDDYPLTWWMK